MRLPLEALAMSSIAALVKDDVRPMASVLMTTTGKVMVADYDGQTFTPKLNATVVGAPSWAHFVQPNLLYTLNENGADMNLFKLDFACNGSVALSEPVASSNGSAGVVHIEMSKDNTRMVGSGYGSGKIDIWDVTGEQLRLIKSLDAPGSPGPEQTGSHPHQAVLDPSGRYFAVNDLGTDSIHFIDSKDDKFDIVGGIKTAAGCAPRHGVFYPFGAPQATHYMLLCEKGNVVVLYQVAYTDNNITFTETQTISTFASGTAPKGAAAGELVLSPNNKYLYASNRVTGGATDSIAHFNVGENGTLVYISEASTGGKRPRMFSLYANGTEVLVGNQDGPLAVTAYTIEDGGSIAKNARASMDIAMFGGDTFGPPFVKQIR